MYVEILHRKKSICVFAVVEQGTLSFGTHLIVRRRTNLKKKKIQSFGESTRDLGFLDRYESLAGFSRGYLPAPD